jgi:dolichol kinase
MVNARKLVHLSGTAFPLIAALNPYLALAGISMAIIAFFSMEILKGRVNIPLASSLYREQERPGPAGEPLLYLISIASLLAISLFFMPMACYAAIIVLTLGDGVAGPIGKAFGRRKLPGSRKTWAGSLAGFTLAAAAGFIFAGPAVIAGAAAGMAVEGYAPRLENLLVPAAAFLTMAILSLLI